MEKGLISKSDLLSLEQDDPQFLLLVDLMHDFFCLENHDTTCMYIQEAQLADGQEGVDHIKWKEIVQKLMLMMNIDIETFFHSLETYRGLGLNATTRALIVIHAVGIENVTDEFFSRLSDVAPCDVEPVIESDFEPSEEYD